MTVARKACTWLVWSVFLIGIPPAAAQPQWSVSTGYQVLHLVDNWVPLGVNFDVAAGRSETWNILGEFGVVHDSDDVSPTTSTDFNIYNLGGGVRWSQRRGAIVPFLQVIAGVQVSTSETDSDTAFMLQPGGGILVPVSDRWGLSAQVDYRPVFYSEEVIQEVRFVVGVRWSIR
jgi:hypothetical protein